MQKGRRLQGHTRTGSQLRDYYKESREQKLQAGQSIGVDCRTPKTANKPKHHSIRQGRAGIRVIPEKPLQRAAAGGHAFLEIVTQVLTGFTASVDWATH